MLDSRVLPLGIVPWPFSPMASTPSAGKSNGGRFAGHRLGTWYPCSSRGPRSTALPRCASYSWPRWRSPRRKPKSSTDEYSGPAFLLELARSWPASRSDRIETICVVGAMPEVGHVVTRRILSLIETESSAKPTLLVTVYGPGIGPELVIDARRHRAFVEAAARDLWIPLRTRSVNPLSSLGFFQAFRDRNEDDVRISGSRPGGETVTELDGGALDRTAQLCTEIALRWARQQSQEPRAPGEDRTASRSSQKPG